MTFDPTKPVEDSPLDAAEVRNQLNALKSLIDAQQQQIAPLVPALARDDAGHWTLTYGGPRQDYWQVWARYTGSENWSNFGETRTMNFPVADGDIAPDGVSWWQVKICGEDEDGNQCTPFSNVISFGPVV